MSSILNPPRFAVTLVEPVTGYTKPAVGYKVFSYSAGTSTPKATFTDAGLGTPNANPTILDARGEASIRLDGSYKIVLKTDADVTVYTEDNVSDLTASGVLTNVTLAGTLAISGTAVTWSGNPTHSGNHAWSGNQLFNGNVTLGDAAADALTVNPNAVTWAGNPTHSGNHTFSGNILGGYTLTSFTPGVSFGALSVGVTYNANRAGQYIQVGKMIFFQLRMRLTSKGSSTGSAAITGLPFAMLSSGVTQAPVSVTAISMTGLTGAMAAQCITSLSTISLSQWGATGDVGLTDANLTNTSDIYVSGAYPVL